MLDIKVEFGGGRNMLTQVIRVGNHYDYVTDFMLETLIKSKEIVKFKSSTGWVTIGAYPISGDDRLAVNDAIFVREYLRAHH